MPVIPPVDIDPTVIEDVSDIRYYRNGALDLRGSEKASGWVLVAQELWMMMISDERTMGSNGDLAIDIRQFIDYPPGQDTAEMIEDHIMDKISIHPLLKSLGIVVETVPTDADKFEIIYKKPVDPTGLSQDVEDLEFNVKVDVRSGAIMGLLEENEPRILYTETSLSMTEIKHIKEATSFIMLEYEPIESEGISVYNFNDVNIVDGVIQAEELSASANINIRPGLVYPLYDYFDDSYLDGRVVKEHHLYDSEDNEVAAVKYGIINNSLIPSYSVISPGDYRLDIVTEKRYANAGDIIRERRDSQRFIYPFLRPYVYRIAMSKPLMPGEYIIKYNIYSE